MAGTDPAARTAATIARPVSTATGAGSPWLRKADSSATTGRPADSAACTSGRISSTPTGAARSRYSMTRSSAIFQPPSSQTRTRVLRIWSE